MILRNRMHRIPWLRLAVFAVPSFAALALVTLASLASVAPVEAQIKIGTAGSGTPPSGFSQSQGAPVSMDPSRPDTGEPDPDDDAAPHPTAVAGADGAGGGDLLSRYEKGAGGKPKWLAKVMELMGSGGEPPKQAAKAYADGDYDKALQKFAEAQLDHPESQALAYNIGNAQFRKKKYDDAIAAYKKALHGDDAGVAAAAYYNMGNSHFRKGEFAIQSGKQEGIEDYREAMAMYKKSLEIRPDDKNAKRNIEVVQARIKELLDRQKQDNQQQQGNPQKPPEPDKEAKEAFARAMQLVQQHRYTEAKQVLEDIIQKNKTAASYQTHVQRIDDILKIMRGEAPTPPQRQDPRASQPGVGVI
jgi:thioredoxin-like negative regulator of GroEL